MTPSTAPLPGAVLLDYPFTGIWRVQMSPAHRLPSHGTELFGLRHAIDFVPVDESGRSAPITWRTLTTAEPPEVFIGFGRPVLAPASGVVVRVHDGEPDHGARRTLLPQIPYALTQARRGRGGAAALAGNHVVLALGGGGAAADHDPTRGPYVLLAHLKRGSIPVSPGDRVSAGDQLGHCGNSGNSTEPHLHVQVNSSRDPAPGNALPVGWRSPGGGAVVPGENELIRI